MSDFDHFKVFFSCATFRTTPPEWNVFPARAGGDTVLRPTDLLFIHQAADEAHPYFVGGAGFKLVHCRLSGAKMVIGISCAERTTHWQENQHDSGCGGGAPYTLRDFSTRRNT